MTLDEAKANIGKSVEYRTPSTPRWAHDTGVITSVNDTYVFVRYEGHFDGVATKPENLTLENA